MYIKFQEFLPDSIRQSHLFHIHWFTIIVGNCSVYFCLVNCDVTSTFCRTDVTSVVWFKIKGQTWLTQCMSSLTQTLHSMISRRHCYDFPWTSLHLFTKLRSIIQKVVSPAEISGCHPCLHRSYPGSGTACWHWALETVTRMWLCGRAVSCIFQQWVWSYMWKCLSYFTPSSFQMDGTKNTYKAKIQTLAVTISRSHIYQF